MWRSVLRTPVAIAAVATCVGCASASTSSGGSAADVLTLADLLETNEPDLYRAVDRLRPRWLRARGQATLSGSTEVALFVDGAPRGTVAQMRGMQVNDVESVTHYAANEAGFRFGTIAGVGGAIAIQTRR